MCERRALFLYVIGLSLPVAACGGGPSAPTQPLPPVCERGVALAIAPGASPTFSWAPPCRAGR